MGGHIQLQPARRTTGSTEGNIHVPIMNGVECLEKARTPISYLLCPFPEASSGLLH
jgi:hypothetical protein